MMIIRTLSHSLFILLVILTAVAATEAQSGRPVVQTEVWCVAKNNAEDVALQSAIDWACGPGGADCGPIQQGGPCYDPADILQTASYAFNDYYLKHGMTDDACFFDNTAALTSLNPSHESCKFPSSKTTSNRSIANATATPETGSYGSDLSSGDRNSMVWFWPVVIVHTLFITRIFFHQ